MYKTCFKTEHGTLLLVCYAIVYIAVIESDVT